MNKNAMSLLLAAGMVTPALATDTTPQAMDRSYLRSDFQTKGHIYVNAATGEKIGNMVQNGARGLPPEVWMSDNDTPCADVGGFDGGYVTSQDNPAGISVGGELWFTYGAAFLNWGDVASDTVIDTIQLATSALHPDVNGSDDFPVGVEGLCYNVAIYEGDNGFNSCFRVPVVGLQITNIPGSVDGGIELWVWTFDLGGADFSFEIGDTDGDLQGAFIHNPFGNANGELDLDFDGLVDFSYATWYNQPGTVDVDDDGIPDGDPANRAIAYAWIAGPRMTVSPTTPPFTYTIDPISAGSEDGWDVFIDNTDVMNENYRGNLWYLGFTCDANGNGTYENTGDDINPFGQFFVAMYAGDVTPPPCRQDINDDGLLNFFDISTFIALFNAQNPAADFFPVAAGDGLFNFFDLSTFIAEFNAGCPN